jgi:hypothetical protein
MNFWNNTQGLEPEKSIKDIRKHLGNLTNMTQQQNIDFSIILKNFSKFSFSEKLASLDIAVENLNIF